MNYPDQSPELRKIVEKYARRFRDRRLIPSALSADELSALVRELTGVDLPAPELAVISTDGDGTKQTESGAVKSVLKAIRSAWATTHNRQTQAMRPGKLVRIRRGDTCPMCSALAGTYTSDEWGHFADVETSVGTFSPFAQHKGCDCVIEGIRAQ